MKVLAVLYYFLFSLPYIYLIFAWGGLIPTALMNPEHGRKLGDKFFLIHIGYACTMISFYLLPLLLFKEKNLLILIKNFFTTKLKHWFLEMLFKER